MKWLKMDFLVLSFAGAAIMANAYAYSLHSRLKYLKSGRAVKASQDVLRRDRALHSLAGAVSSGDEARFSEAPIDAASEEDGGERPSQGGFANAPAGGDAGAFTVEEKARLLIPAAPKKPDAQESKPSLVLLSSHNEVSPELVRAVESAIVPGSGDDPQEAQDIGDSSSDEDVFAESHAELQSNSGPESAAPGAENGHRLSELEESYDLLAKDLEILKVQLSVLQSAKKESPLKTAQARAAKPAAKKAVSKKR